MEPFSISTIRSVTRSMKTRSWETTTTVLVYARRASSTVAREGSTDHVPFCVWGAEVHPVRAGRFTEVEASAGELHVEDGHGMLEYVMGGRHSAVGGAGRQEPGSASSMSSVNTPGDTHDGPAEADDSASAIHEQGA